MQSWLERPLIWRHVTAKVTFLFFYFFGGEHNWDNEKMPQLLANDQKCGYRVLRVYNHKTCEGASFVVTDLTCVSVHFLSTFLIHFTATFYPTAHRHQLSSRWAACSHSTYESTTYWPNWTKLLSFIQRPSVRGPTAWFSLINSLLSIYCPSVEV